MGMIISCTKYRRHLMWIPPSEAKLGVSCITKRFVSVFLLSVLSVSLSFAGYSGRVYIDNNRSGTFDRGDTPVQGVVVTDGQNTVKTLEDGKFTLPGYEKTRFITITTPAGYETEKYYIPVNESVKTCDFAVYPSERTKQAEHSFIQITDTEIHNRGTANSWVAYLKDFVRTEKASFLIHTGDICYESGLRNHIQVVNAKTMDCPVYYCIGNHDLVKGEYGEQLFESIYGPVWYSFDIGNVHYVVTPMANGDHKPGYTRKEIYQWLQNDLAMMTPGKQLVIFNHNILTASDHFYFGTGETERINLRDYNLKAWIYGHWHYNYVRNQAGIYTVCTATLDKGGIDHSPSAFRFFRMQKDSIASMNLHYCFLERQTVIACPSEGQTAPILPDGRIPVSVNAYHSGCEIKQVTYRFTDKRDNRGYQKMLRKSDWNWYAEIRPPQDSSQPQTMELEIATEFNDGKSTLSTCRFLYDPDNKPGIKTGQDWFNLLKDAAHRGNSSDSLKLPLQLGWINNLGSNIFMTSPLIANRRIFIAATDDHQAEKQGVFALDERTGRILWKYPTRNSVKNSIAYDLNTVFAQDANGWLYAIDADSGKLRWEKQPDPGFFPYLEDGLIACNGVVYAGTGTGLGAYRGMDGTAIWLNKAWKKGEGTTTTLTLGNNVLTAGVQWTALYGNNAETGELLWKLSNDGLSDRGASTVLHEDQFYVISRNSLFIIEPLTGKILRQKQLTEFNLNVTSTPLITDSEVIFGTADKGIVALDKENLSVKWNTITGQSLVYTSPYTTLPFASVETSPVVSNGIVYFGASDGYLYGVKAGTGEIVWKYRTGAPVFASVAISGNALIAVDFSGNVYAFYGLNHSDI